MNFRSLLWWLLWRMHHKTDNQITMIWIGNVLCDRWRLSWYGIKDSNIHYHNVTPPLPRRQLEAGDVGSELLDGLHQKMRRRSVKQCHSTAVSAWRVRRDDAIPSRPAGVDSVCYLGFLEDYQVHVGLGHPPQLRLQSSITVITVVIGPEPNWYLPSCRNPSTPTHPPPTDSFFTPAPAALPVQ